MKKLTILILFILTGPIYSQVTYASYLTQSFPTIFTTEIKDITRTIILEPETITIVTEVINGKEIEVLNIEGHELQNGNFIFFCKRNNKSITIAIPEQEQIEIIDYYYFSPKKKRNSIKVSR